jgi:hypothetical protein
LHSSETHHDEEIARVLILVLLTLITGLAYPLAMTAIAGVLFPKQAQGSLVEKDGKVIGSALIGQEFKDGKYFHGRPSATSGPDPADSAKTVPVPYNAANSSGSNLGPTSKALNDRIKEEVEKLKAENASLPSRLISSPRRRPRSNLAGSRPVPGAAHRKAQHAGRAGSPAGDREYPGPPRRIAGRTARQRAGAESGFGSCRVEVACA